MIRSILALTLCLVPLHAEALGRLTASNGLAVAGEGARIEVYSRAALPGAAYFCAAGDFARAALRARANDRVTVVVALSPSQTRPGQNSVVFELSGPDRGGLKGNPFLWVRGTGRSLTVGHARFLCNQANSRQRD